jgi:asparagine synthase (glutamine-hydrolysing)
MCGIFCIYFSDTSRPIHQDLVINATNEMTHRGPDDTGIYISGNVGFGHTRLSIIDLSNGHQPMFNEDGQVVLIYNGEIYNHREIRELLLTKGHSFQTNCDTEVIIHAYEEWGVDCINKFNGMFAFALLDEKENSLWIARDRLGIKPLYYYWDSETFLCASEIKPILNTGLVPIQINERVLDAYFSLGYVPAPETMFKNIFKLQPGHFLRLRSRQLTNHQYWDFANVESSDVPFEAAKQRVTELLQDSVNKRLMSDVPLGVFLSGGLDSSSIVAVMDDFVNEPINTFTVVYDDAYGVSEGHYAQIVSEKYQTKHHVFQLEPQDFFTSVETLVHYAEEPLVETPAIALYHLAKLARRHAIVLLSGEGSDEVFAGYLLYDFMKQLERFQKITPQRIRQKLPLFASLLPKLKYRKYLDWLALPLTKRYQGTSSYLTPSLKSQLYAPDFFRSKGEYLNEVFSLHFQRVQHKRDPIDKMLYVDTKTWLADDLLLKADKMTMAASVELRVPFLDYRLVELLASLPSSYKIKNGSRKHILKSVMHNKIPVDIINRKKMGFPVPTNKWFRSDLLQNINDQLSNSPVISYFNQTTLKKMLKQHQNKSQDHTKFIMTLLVLSFWHDKYLI